MPAKILINQESKINKYILDDLKISMSVPQRKHLELLVTGIIGSSDKRTISNIVRSSVSKKDRSCTQKFLNSSPWNEDDAKLKQKKYIETILEKELEVNSEPFFAILDDTIIDKSKDSKKIAGMGYHYSHSSGKQEWSHNIQSLHCVAGNISVPFDFEMYLKSDYCEANNLEFKSKVDISIDMLKCLELQKEYRSYFLIDSWYTSPKLINKAAEIGFHTIGALKSNRIFYPMGIRHKLSEFIQYITDSDLDLVTVKGKDYKIYRYEGHMNDLENAVVLITWDISSPNAEPKYILCTDVTLDSKTIMLYYSKRWHIETSFRYLKDRLGLDHYQMRSLKAIKRFLIIQYISYAYVEFFRHKNKIIPLSSNFGDTIDFIKLCNMKYTIGFIYDCGKNNVDIKSLYESFGIPA